MLFDKVWGIGPDDYFVKKISLVLLKSRLYFLKETLSVVCLH